MTYWDINTVIFDCQIVKGKYHLSNDNISITYIPNLINWEAVNPVNIYLFKVNNKNIRKRFEICSKLTIKKPERSQLLVQSQQ